MITGIELGRLVMSEFKRELTPEHEGVIRSWVGENGLDEYTHCNTMNDYELKLIRTPSPSNLTDSVIFAIVCPYCENQGAFPLTIFRYHSLEVVGIDPKEYV